MSTFKKHTDVVATEEAFNANLEAGKYSAPWIVYVGNDETGYKVYYSSDESHEIGTSDPTYIDSLQKRIEKLEEEKVYCFDEEYNTLVTNGIGWVTNIDGERTEVTFDENKLYCIYEDDGSIEQMN